jgi:type I restriction enzyme M protein
MFVQHMVAVLKADGRMTTIMPDGVLFRGGEEKEARKHFIERGWLEAIIGLPAGLFYGTGIPACVLVINKKGATARKHVLFINADREYREGKSQNFLRPEDISKIVHAYREHKDVPDYARLVPISEIADEDYNCNIRRYVDNAPPPEPHDVRAHLHGGVPVAEIDALAHFWKNYADFAAEVTDRRALADLVKSDPGVAKAHAKFLRKLEIWWEENVSSIEELAPQNGRRGNVYDLRRQLLDGIAATFAGQTLLTDHKVRGAFARYVDDLKADLKSVAASGWGPELIPNDDILESQFPQLLAEMEQKRLRLAELSTLFAAADEEDYEDSDDIGVLPGDEVKSLKAELKETRAQARLAKKEGQVDEWQSHVASVAEMEKRLARHKALEDEARQLKNDLRVNEKRQEELVTAAREKISRDEARNVIVDRFHRLLLLTYETYLGADQNECILALENLHGKYAITMQAIETKRNAAALRLRDFLSELGYV